MERLETLVIGAGPAGLAAAASLSKRGAPFVIVEQATAVGSSWRRHYQRLHLHTDQAHSALPYLGFPPGTPRYPSREEMIGYLERYARHFALTPRLGERVLSSHPADNGWVATTTASIYCCQRVIVATGYNAVPYLPSWPGQERFSGRIMHSSEYRNADPFRGQSVLVIGFGNSGGEIAIDLHEHGARVAMAVRGAVNIVPRDIFGLPTVAIAHALSRLPAGLADALAAPLLRLAIGDITKLGFRKLSVGPIEQILTKSRIPLIDIGTVRLVRSGDIEILGGVDSMSEIRTYHLMTGPRAASMRSSSRPAIAPGSSASSGLAVMASARTHRTRMAPRNVQPGSTSAVLRFHRPACCAKLESRRIGSLSI